jgi:hypothetical protein
MPEITEIDDNTIHENVVILKDAGNEAFKMNDMKAALESYGRAIKLTDMILDKKAKKETAGALYRNRAMAYIKLEKFENAERDCTSGELMGAHVFVESITSNRTRLDRLKSVVSSRMREGTTEELWRRVQRCKNGVQFGAVESGVSSVV